MLDTQISSWLSARGHLQDEECSHPIEEEIVRQYFTAFNTPTNNFTQHNIAKKTQPFSVNIWTGRNYLHPGVPLEKCMCAMRLLRAGLQAGAHALLSEVRGPFMSNYAYEG